MDRTTHPAPATTTAMPGADMVEVTASHVAALIYLSELTPREWVFRGAQFTAGCMAHQLNKIAGDPLALALLTRMAPLFDSDDAFPTYPPFEPQRAKDARWFAPQVLQALIDATPSH